MTKKVRIENADTSDFKVVVEIWHKGRDGAPDEMVKEVLLSHPTAMTGDECYLTDMRYIVVREAQT